ncbi:MAG: ABC transporter permease subunit [Rhodospirillales bacterium]|nr:ABC transporter permease subunit [Rhodospirillales bacterium]
MEYTRELFQGYQWVFWAGAEITLLVGLASLPIALVLGLLGAWSKLCSIGPLRGLAVVYTTVVRGVPELVLILLFYYGLTILLQDLIAFLAGSSEPVDLPRFLTGTMTLGLIYGAFATEVFRGAYLAVSRGQIEAASAFGMSPFLAFRRVILPQMWRFALPGLGNLWLVLIKATALVSVIQLPDLMYQTNVGRMATRAPFTFYFTASLIYLLITAVSLIAIRYAEQWASRGVVRKI